MKKNRNLFPAFWENKKQAFPNREMPVLPIELELMTGFEPVTYALPRRCATTCATSADMFLTTVIIITYSASFVKGNYKKNEFFL